MTFLLGLADAFEGFSALRLGRRSHAREPATLRDLTALPDAGFNAVVAYGGPLSYAFEEVEPSLAGMLRVVRPGGRVVASVIALIGTLRMFVRVIPGYAGKGRLDELKAVMATGENRLDTGGHPCRMFRWSEIEAMAGRLPCAVLGASASNFLSSADQDVIAYIRAGPVPVAAPARLGGGVLRRAGRGGQRHTSAVRPGAISEQKMRSARDNLSRAHRSPAAIPTASIVVK